MAIKSVETVDDFEKELESAGSKLVVVDFYADWCGPCRRIAPFLEKMSKEHEDVVFLKVNVDDASEIAEKQDIKAMPTFRFFIGKVKRDEVLGASEAKLKEKIESLKAGTK